MRELNTILEKKLLAEKINQYLIYSPHIARKAKAGQFVILRLCEDGERVPLTIVDHDADEGTITLIVQTVGKSTMMLDAQQPGETIHDVLGPLGNPSEIKNYGRVAVIGGGVGAAVAYPVAKALKLAGNHVTSIVGARNKDLVILKPEIEQVSDRLLITTDDGSCGLHGFVTDQLRILLEAGEHFDYVLAIGPLFMMRAVAELTRPYEIRTTVSLNTIMVDGTGMCGGCRVQVGDKVKFTCVDGPEFDGHLVDFETVINRNRTYNHPEDCRLDTQIADIEIALLEEQAPQSAKERQIVPELPAHERVRNFQEVALDLTPEQALIEAERCLQCRTPLCVQGCPVAVKIPQFIQLIKQGDPVGAGRLIKNDNALPRVCGRVCPQEDQCEGACILIRKGKPINIGALERYVSDALAAAEPEVEPSPNQTPFRAAMIGSGPASLSCAGDLARAGVQVTVFEAFHDFGGVLRYGIPEFRLPKSIVTQEVDSLSQAGVKFVPNTLIGATFTIDELLKNEKFDAIFIGTGAGLPNFLGIEGESLVGVYSANEFLTRVNLMKAYEYPYVDTPILNMLDKTVGVFGGGNTALDSARVALRLGAAKVYIIYRRTQAEMPGRKEEIEHALAEGVEFAYLSAPQEFLGNHEGRLTGVRLQKMELGEPDASGRRRPVPLEGSEYEIDLAIAIVAIGNGSNPIVHKSTPALDVDKWGHILVDPETSQTSIPGVYAGGDIVTGGATVIKAMGAGRKAAASILRQLGLEVIA
ncbi:MAG TPA: NADPH-dependent glutamate synthase [Anaerolineaceae bacterium]|nr:NADPH-dependent glutamate synthase [Anaerolineaceae bacterium]